MGDWPFSFSDDVRFADLDAMGHLNNVTFLVFFENARVAYVTEALGAREPGGVAGPGFVVAETKIAYRSPGRYGERIETLLRPGTIGRSSFSCEFEMRVGERLLAEGYAVMVAYDTGAAKPVPVPGPLRERLLADGAVPR